MPIEILTPRENPLSKVNFWGQSLALEVGQYEQAAKSGMSMTAMLEEIKTEKEGKESYYYGMTDREAMRERLRLKRAGLVIPKMAFTEVLDRAGIHAFGARTDNVDKFFEFSQVDVLFAEFFNNRVLAGLVAASLVPEFTMGETVISALDYYKIYIEDVEAYRQMSAVDELVDIPSKAIRVTKEGIHLTKYAYYLMISYEALRYHRLNVFGRALELVGLQLGVDETDEMFYVGQNGDGNSNTPSTAIQADATGNVGTADLLHWSSALPTPYKMDKHAGQKEALLLWNTALASFQNPMATFGYMGVDLPRSFEWDCAVIASDVLYGTDSRYGLEHITTGTVQNESEKLVRRQGQGTSIWIHSSFSVFDKKANGTMDISY